MRRLLSSLQVRLIVGFVAALALALSSVGLYVGYAADREVARLREEFTDAREARLKLALEEHYARNKGWYQVQPFLERVGPVYGKRLVLKDEDGQIVGDSWGDKKGFPSGRTRPHRGITISMSEADPKMASVMEDKKREVGELTVAADDLPEPLMEPPLSRLSQTVNRSLLWAGLVAGGGGLVLVTMMSSSALAPVRTLTGAARRLGRGDLSQRVSVRGEDEVGQLARTFNSMAEGMEQAETQRRNLVADVAHELRSPLSNIQGTIEAMRDGLMDRGDSSLDMLHEQTLHLSHLVDDLGLLAMAEAGDLRLDIKPDSVEDAARRSIEAFRARAEAKGVGLTVEAAENLPLAAMDRQRTQQIIGNLLDNAIRHTPAGGRVGVHVDSTGSEAVSVAVRDTGQGIAEDDLPLIFERFHRIDPSRTRATGGAGLGLTIARRLVEAQGGTIRADSEIGKGTTFTVELPAATGVVSGREN